jgi:hypothetical protein
MSRPLLHNRISQHSSIKFLYSQSKLLVTKTMTLPTLFRRTDLGISYYFQMIIGREMKTAETAARFQSKCKELL